MRAPEMAGTQARFADGISSKDGRQKMYSDFGKPWPLTGGYRNEDGSRKNGQCVSWGLA